MNFYVFIETNTRKRKWERSSNTKAYTTLLKIHIWLLLIIHAYFFKGITRVYEMIYEICNFILSIVLAKHCVICNKIMNKHKNQTYNETYIRRKHTYSETYVYRICTMVIKYGKQLININFYAFIYFDNVCNNPCLLFTSFFLLNTLGNIFMFFILF